MIIQPRHNGTAANRREPRLPIVSKSGPERRDPIGVAKLWTEAEGNKYLSDVMKNTNLKIRKCYVLGLFILFFPMVRNGIVNFCSEF